MTGGLLISLVFLLAFCGIGSADLEITPIFSVIEVGSPVNISCQLDSAQFLPLIVNKTAVFQWKTPGENIISIGQSLNGRISAVSETTNQTKLVILKALLNDTGSFECLLIKNATNGGITILANATAELKTYVLSSYFVEGMIVLAVNCVLFVIFLICSVRQCCIGRRKGAGFKKYDHFNNNRNDIDRSNLMERAISQE